MTIQGELMNSKHADVQYKELCNLILEQGVKKSDRTGVGTTSIFGHQIRFDLSQGFPLLTTKKMYFKGIVHELLWFLAGDTNVKYLNDNNVKIWNEWADESGDLGPIYGFQWRHFDGDYIGIKNKFKWPSMHGTDQIQKAVDDLKNDPNSRRIIVTAWNPNQLKQQALPACHTLFQLYVANGKLSLHLYQRAADMFIGAPFNIASYALLTHMFAQVSGLQVGDLVISFGDAHIYNNHLEQIKEQISRDPHPMPKLELNPEVKDIFSFKYEDIKLVGYESHAAIKANVAV